MNGRTKGRVQPECEKAVFKRMTDTEKKLRVQRFKLKTTYRAKTLLKKEKKNEDT